MLRMIYSRPSTALVKFIDITAFSSRLAQTNPLCRIPLSPTFVNHFFLTLPDFWQKAPFLSPNDTALPHQVSQIHRHAYAFLSNATSLVPKTAFYFGFRRNFSLKNSGFRKWKVYSKDSLPLHFFSLFLQHFFKKPSHFSTAHFFSNSLSLLFL